MIRIVIADDHPIMREGLRRLIERQHDMRLVREVADGRQALKAASECEFDVLVLDLSLPRVNGLEIVRRVSATQCCVRIVVLSMYPADQYEARAIEMGAAAYVSKDSPPEELLRVVRAVMSAGPMEEREPSRRPAAAFQPPHKTLTSREYQVFTLVFQGETVAEIAAELNLTSSTVSNHLAKIREKLGVRSIGEIVSYAHEMGLTGSSVRPR